MTWAAEYINVPHVLDQGTDEDGAWIVTTAIVGENAVSDRWRKDPETAVRALGMGLRALHESLPVKTCPFQWSVEERTERARRDGIDGLLEPARWHHEHRSLTVDAALSRLGDPPTIDKLVVCHGDACAPNTILGMDGRWLGHVDLGSLGLADRWADLAVATWSTQWNYGPDWENPLLDAYGIEPDVERTRFYRLLWDLSD